MAGFIDVPTSNLFHQFALKNIPVQFHGHVVQHLVRAVRHAHAHVHTPKHSHTSTHLIHQPPEKNHSQLLLTVTGPCIYADVVMDVLKQYKNYFPTLQALTAYFQASGGGGATSQVQHASGEARARQQMDLFLSNVTAPTDLPEAHPGTPRIRLIHYYSTTRSVATRIGCLTRRG